VAKTQRVFFTFDERTLEVDMDCQYCGEEMTKDVRCQICNGHVHRKCTKAHFEHLGKNFDKSHGKQAVAKDKELQKVIEANHQRRKA